MLVGVLMLALVGPPEEGGAGVEAPSVGVLSETAGSFSEGGTVVGENAQSWESPSESSQAPSESPAAESSQAPSESPVAESSQAPSESPVAESSVAVEGAIQQPEIASSPHRDPRTRRCLSGVDPCYRTTAGRLLLGGLGTVALGTSVGLVFSAGDRNRLGDPALALAGAGVLAVGAALLGGAVNLLGGDGPTLYDRITPATLYMTFGLGGSSISDERLPYNLTASAAPTLRFPRALGRLRLLGTIGGDLGSRIERDPRPQTTNPDGTFSSALEIGGWDFLLGLDLAVAFPYPLAPHRASARLGQLEFRYKPLFFFSRDVLDLGGEPRVNQRVMLTPLNLGFRWHISPRQRFTFYMGPRWDLIAHGEPGELATGVPALGPIYSETWFDVDIPVVKLARAKRATVVAQYTVGYVHSRFYGNGLNIGSIVGFLGHVSTQLALRVRPRSSIAAYQVELGARIGQGLSPFVRVGLVLPDIEVAR